MRIPRAWAFVKIFLPAHRGLRLGEKESDSNNFTNRTDDEALYDNDDGSPPPFDHCGPPVVITMTRGGHTCATPLPPAAATTTTTTTRNTSQVEDAAILNTTWGSSDEPSFLDARTLHTHIQIRESLDSLHRHDEQVEALCRDVAAMFLMAEQMRETGQAQQRTLSKMENQQVKDGSAECFAAKLAELRKERIATYKRGAIVP
jgi:hypothetical protein